MAISITNIIKNSLKFSATKAISALLGLPVTIYVATILGPEEYGIYGLLALWLMYATLIGPGILSAGLREVPVLLGRDKEEEALKVQNISISSEMLYVIMPFVAILGASLFYPNTVLKFGLVIIAASYVTGRLSNFWIATNYCREKFDIVAKGNLVAAILTPLAILASVNWLGVYALLMGPLISNVALWIYYLKKGAINYRFTFERNETVRLIKVGVVLQGLTFALWAFRMADRTIIASTLPLEQLGLYTFAIGFLMYALTLPTDFSNVLSPILWREASKASSILEGFKDIKRIAIYMALGVAIIIPLSQLGFYLVVNLFTTQYMGSIPIFYVLSYNLYLVSVAVIASLVLHSRLVNRQNITLCFYAIGLALNIVFDLLVIRLGYGVIGVAWVTICTQGLVTFLLYYFVRSYVFYNVKEFVRFMVLIVAPFLISISFYFLHNYLNLTISDLKAFVAISLATQAIVWSLIISIFYRNYVTINDIKSVLREISVAMRDRLHI